MTDKATQIIANAMRGTGCYERVNIEDHAQAIRAALAAARIELIELPEPENAEAYDTGDGHITVWTWPTGVTTDDETRTVFDDNGIEIGLPDDARAYAADILAAAHTAETQHAAQER